MQRAYYILVIDRQEEYKLLLRISPESLFSPACFVHRFKFWISGSFTTLSALTHYLQTLSSSKLRQTPPQFHPWNPKSSGFLSSSATISGCNQLLATLCCTGLNCYTGVKCVTFSWSSSCILKAQHFKGFFATTNTCYWVILSLGVTTGSVFCIYSSLGLSNII